MAPPSSGPASPPRGRREDGGAVRERRAHARGAERVRAGRACARPRAPQRLGSPVRREMSRSRSSAAGVHQAPRPPPSPGFSRGLRAFAAGPGTKVSAPRGPGLPPGPRTLHPAQPLQPAVCVACIPPRCRQAGVCIACIAGRACMHASREGRAAVRSTHSNQRGRWLRRSVPEDTLAAPHVLLEGGFHPPFFFFFWSVLCKVFFFF